MPDARRPTEHARTACLGAAVLGLAVIAFASFGLAIVGLQRMMLTAMTTESDRELLELLTVFDALHGLWLVHLPTWIASGAVLVGLGAISSLSLAIPFVWIARAVSPIRA